MRATTVTITASATGGAQFSAPIIPDRYISPFNLALLCTVSGTASYSVQATGDDVFSTSFLASTATWFEHPTLTSQTANNSSNYAFPVTAVRLVKNSGAGVTTLQLIQAGIGGL